MAGNSKITYTLDFKANLTDVQGQLNRLKQSLMDVSRQSVINPKITQKMREAANSASILHMSLQKALNVNTGKLDLTRMNMEIKNMGYSLDKLSADLIKAGPVGQKAFMEITMAMGNTERQVIRLSTLTQKLMTTLGNTLRWQISSMALTGLYSGIFKAFNYAKDLNNTLNDIRIVTGDSAEEMDRFAKSANKMAKAVGSTTLDVAKGTLIYRQQGDEAELAAKKAEITTKAANIAFNASSEEMSQYLTAIWNSYQVEEDQLELFVDKLAVVGAETATNMEEISTAMEKVAATANTTGVTYDQLLATISTVSSVTRQSAETVGTAFKTIYARIGDLKIDGETVDEDGVAVKLGQVSSQLADANIHILDANGNMRDMGAIVEEIGGKWQTLESAEKQAIAQTIAGKRQYTQVMALFENWDMYEETLGKVADAQGALNNQNEIFKESWEGALKEVSNNWQKLITTLISDDFIIDIIKGFSDIIDILGEFIDSIGGFKTILYTVGAILTKTFSIQISNGLINLASGFANLIGLGKKWNQTLLDSQLETIKTAVKNGELDKQYADQLTIVLKLNQASEQFNATKDKMSTVKSFALNNELKILKQEIESRAEQIEQLKIKFQTLSSGVGFSFSGVNNIKPTINQAKELAQALITVDFNIDNLDQSFYKTFTPDDIANFNNELFETQSLTNTAEDSFLGLNGIIDNFVKKLNNSSPKTLKELEKDSERLTGELNQLNEKYTMFLQKNLAKMPNANNVNILRYGFERLIPIIQNTSNVGDGFEAEFKQIAGELGISADKLKHVESLFNGLKKAMESGDPSREDFESDLREIINLLNNTEKELDEVNKKSKETPSPMKKDFAQSISNLTSGIMNSMMVITSFQGMLRTLNDDSATLSDKITSIGYTLTSFVMGLSPAFSAAATAAASGASAMTAFWVAAWPLLAITAGVGIAIWLEKIIVTADEAKENIKELNAEFKDLKGQIKDLDNKTKTIEDLFEEYSKLKSKMSFGELSDEEQKKLSELSKTLVDDYELEATSLNNLRETYDISKTSIESYTESLRKERLEKQKQLMENRKEVIKNQLIKDKDEASSMRGNKFSQTEEYVYNDETGLTDLKITKNTSYSDEKWSKLWKIAKDEGYDYEAFEEMFKISGSTIVGGTDQAKEIINIYDQFYESKAKDIEHSSKKNVTNFIEDMIEANTGNFLDSSGYEIAMQGINEFLQSDHETAKKVTSDETKAEWYSQNIEKFAEEYAANINDIATKDKMLKEKISSGEGLSLDNYTTFFKNIGQQAALLNEKFKKGIIDADTYNSELEKLENSIHEDVSLTLEKIDSDYDNLGSSFNKLKEQTLDLTNSFNTGKISQIEYFTSLVDNLNNTKDAFGENKEAMVEYFSSITTQGQNALKNLVSSYNSGQVKTSEFIDKISGLVDTFAKLENQITESLGGDKSKVGDGFDKLSEKLANLKKELLAIKEVLPNITKEAGKSTTQLATYLGKIGVTADDLKDIIKDNTNDIKDLGDNSLDNAKTNQDVLERSSDSYALAMAAAQNKYKTVMYNIGIAIGQIIGAVTNFLKDFEVGLEVPSLWELIKGTGVIKPVVKGSYDFDKETAKQWYETKNPGKDTSNFDNNEWFIGFKARASGMSSADFYNKYHNNNDYEAMKKGYYSGINVETAGMEMYFGETLEDTDLFQAFTGDGTGKKPPSDDKGDKFDPESTVEAQINDLIDKYRTIPALLLEALENEADMLDENIHGWEKIVENQIQQNIVRDDLLENEKKLKEGLNTLLNGLLEEYGLTIEEVSKWFNSEGGETAYFRNKVNDIGKKQGKDAAEKIEDQGENIGKIWKALLESNENLDELTKEQFEGKKNYIDKFTSLMDDNNAKLEEAIEDLENADIVNYESMRDLLQLQIQNRMDLINELIAQGFAKDSPVIRELIQTVKDDQNKIIDTFNDEFKQTKSQLEEIYKEIEYQRKKKIEDLQDEITIRQKLVDLEKKHNSTLKDLRATQRDINKELIDAKASVQWLDKETRDLMFNQEDYYEMSSKISETQEYLNDLYINYKERIAGLDENELYLADSITKSYEAQVAAKKEELEILKASLAIENKRNALNSALSERNVRVFAGGRWRQVINTENVTKAYQEYQDAVNAEQEKKIENSQNNLIRAQEGQIQALDNLKKSYEEQNKMMKEKLEEMEHDWNLLNSNLELSGKSLGELTKTFNDGVSQLKTSMNNLHAQKQAASNVQYGFSSSGGSSGGGQNSDYVNWAKNQMAENSKNWFGADKATQDALAAANKNLASQIGATQDSSGDWIDKNGNKITGNAKGRKDGPGGISQVNELGIELLATNGGQFIELNPHEKIFNNEQMNFLYDFSRRGIESTEKAVSSVSTYNDESLSIENLTLELPNVTDTNSFVEGLKGLKEHMRNVKTIK